MKPTRAYLLRSAFEAGLKVSGVGADGRVQWDGTKEQFELAETFAQKWENYFESHGIDYQLY